MITKYSIIYLNFHKKQFSPLLKIAASYWEKVIQEKALYKDFEGRAFSLVTRYLIYLATNLVKS